MKLNYLIASLAIIVIIVLSAAAFRQPASSLNLAEKRIPLIIRKIGHEVLLHAGDSSSRVLPVQQIADNTFQLAFESPFTLVPDTLVQVVRHELAKAGVSPSYMVDVKECTTEDIVYGFEAGARNIVPCLGRTLPEGCYTMQFVFVGLPIEKSHTDYYLVLGAVAGIALVAFVGKKFTTHKRYTEQDTDYITIGTYRLDCNQQKLIHGNHTVDLSDKETNLLVLFASRQNELIERDYLLQQVWENDGVFTGRSLDVFVSKLRKKLSDDPAVCIVNVHGKGYKLEVV